MGKFYSNSNNVGNKKGSKAVKLALIGGAMVFSYSSIYATNTIDVKNNSTIQEDISLTKLEDSIKPSKLKLALKNEKIVTNETNPIIFSVTYSDGVEKSFSYKEILSKHNLEIESLNSNAIINKDGELVVLDRGEINLKATIKLSEDTVLEGKLVGRSLFDKDTFKLASDTAITIANDKSYLLLEFDSILDINSLSNNIFMSIDEEGNNKLSDINLRIDGKTLNITHKMGWSNLGVEDDVIYLLIDKDLKDTEGVKFDKRIKYKIKLPNKGVK